ncbi:amidohydrolase family protein [Marinovum sp.]|uniref:amidohydrolase family protein n=1 Tax=Marinovum sp. TaxID=2024839 RepID=UPI003A8FC084
MQAVKRYTSETEADDYVVDPDVPITDPHHHIWQDDGLIPYSVDDFLADGTSGHRVERSVFVECDQGYRTDGPEDLRPVGETELARGYARDSRVGPGPDIVGILPVLNARLETDHLRVIEAHEQAGAGLVRGFRARVGYDPARQYVPKGHEQWPGQLQIPNFLEAVRILGRRNLALDLIFYHPQLPEVAEFARQVPDTTIVLNHLAFPIGIGGYAGREAEVEADLRRGIDLCAALPNVRMKLGGFGMALFGYPWPDNGRPANSDEIVDLVGSRVAFMIDAFGPDRCMFESNFPVDALSFGYRTFWNAAKKMVAPYSAEERDLMLRLTAERTYGLGLDDDPRPIPPSRDGRTPTP